VGHPPLRRRPAQRALRRYPKGAAVSATLYSRAKTAKANRRDPYRYLRHLFTALPANPEQIAALLPFNIAPDALLQP
jgi:hypothetical protein